MKKIKHTPGPWSVDPNTSNDVIGGNELIATAYQLNKYQKDDQDDIIPCHIANANAKLIAAAPDMYEALMGVYEEIPENAKSFEMVRLVVQKLMP